MFLLRNLEEILASIAISITVLVVIRGLAYGETLAVVGDNPNARMDPEVIAPLSKLKNMIGGAGGGTVTVVGKLSGQDILLSSEKAGRTRSRYRGF